MQRFISRYRELISGLYPVSWKVGIGVNKSGTGNVNGKQNNMLDKNQNEYLYTTLCLLDNNR